MKYWREIFFRQIEEETNRFRENAVFQTENCFIRKSEFISSLGSSFPIQESCPQHPFIKVLFSQLNAAPKAFLNFAEILEIIGNIDDYSFSKFKKEEDARGVAVSIFWAFHEFKTNWDEINA